jgi:ribosome-associated protein
MEEDLPVTDRITIPGSELSFSASRSGGPGGQHVNKTSTRVTLQWDVSATGALDDAQRSRVLERLAGRTGKDGVLQVSAEDERSQHRNRQVARTRLAALVEQALRVPRRRIPTRPTRASRRRRVEQKKRRGAIKKLRSGPPDDD